MILYKYMTVETAQKVLATNKIGFSRASFFNDPFDTPVATPVLTENPIDGLFADIRAQVKSSVWEKKTALLPLTRTAKNALMWAHYADSHRGAVLAIDTAKAGFLDSDTNMIPAHFGSVVYSRHRPSGAYGSEFGTAVQVGGTHQFVLEHYEKWQRLFLIKPLEWAYEEEVRVAKCIEGLKSGDSENESGSWSVIDSNGRPLHCFHLPAGSITEIYFGARVTDAQVKETIAEHPSVDCYSAQLHQHRFSIDLKRHS
ncbi:DUF2971 domain-containing protein [Nitratireductor sp. XY-223]|uniref:DUF2971 domain-containing protein n=1 Tax=Nitratireductor sp. XY-223 TaxID=2561926 RepID=UPI0010AB1EC1|nr:DUF2971 domain-containing protein [Nitratireductor sp. XY-223]